MSYLPFTHCFAIFYCQIYLYLHIFIFTVGIIGQGIGKAAKGRNIFGIDLENDPETFQNV